MKIKYLFFIYHFTCVDMKEEKRKEEAVCATDLHALGKYIKKELHLKQKQSSLRYIIQ